MARGGGVTEGLDEVTKRLPWFRMWTDARNDSKLDALNDREFRIWHKLLCFAAEAENRGTIDYLDPEYVAMELRIGVDELDSAISRMIRLRLVERSETLVRFPSFADRNYDKPSDKPDAVRERVRKSRAKARGEGSEDAGNAMYRGVTRREEKNRLEKNIGGSGDVDNLPDPKTISEIVAGIRNDLDAKALR